MQKKIILVAATLAFAIGAFYLFSRDDEPVAKREKVDATKAALDFVVRVDNDNDSSMGAGGNLKFRPGEKPRVVIHDQQTGKPKYIFEADEWEPVGDDRFDVRKLRIQSFMPKGEVAYINADQADVTVFQAGDNRFDPRRGLLSGNVRVVIDRTTEAWRAENPDQAARDDHPDDLIHIEMESAQFDLDRSELISNGAVILDSSEARIEDVSDLTVRWDQVDNRLESLKFAHGGRMIIRRGADMVELSLPGSDVESEKNGGDGAATNEKVTIAANAPMTVEQARTDAPVTVATLSAKEAAQQIRAQGLRVRTNQPVSLSIPKKIEDTSIAATSGKPKAPAADVDAPTTDALRSPDAVAADMASLQDEVRTGVIRETEGMSAAELLALKTDPINTYRVLFEGTVVVEQRRGEATVGTLRSDQLEVHFDFGKKQEDVMRGPSANKAGGDKKNKKRDAEAAKEADASEGAQEKVDTSIVLVWNGPFELHPLTVEPEQQSGKRFDVVATGRPVHLTSEQGNATCRQLVFRNESRQVWLSGAGEADVELSVSEGRKLVGGEVYFDQRRGLAHVEGAGHMLDKKPLVGREALAAAFSNENETVEIHWSESVDVEMGRRQVLRKNEATGAMEQKNAEYLRRAWFNGDVRFRRGNELARADKVAATFGPPSSKNEIADFIEHLNLAGSVVLSNVDEFVQADDLDVEMIRSPEGRNIPQRVRGNGRVVVRQKQSEIRANRLDMEMQEIRVASAANGSASKEAPRIGLKWLDAFGEVDVRDPAHNLKIAQAESLKARFDNGDRIKTLNIVSPSPDVFAQARVEDVAVHGHRIDFNMDQQALDVPGPGRAWMITRQDFGGRAMNRPQPVKATWTDQLQLRLNDDYGVFVGDVRIRMEGFAMNSDKLTIRFANVAPIAKKASPETVSRFAMLGEFINGEPNVDLTDRIATGTQRKRPVYVVAEGRAEAMTNTNAPGATPDTPGRLLSRAHIAGNQIIADLEREQMSVPSAGTLLIEDYQFDANSRRPTAAATRGVGGPMMSSVRSDGPSQTLVSWEKSMDSFVDRGLVVFDKSVSMIHCSGRHMVLKDDLLDAMGLSADMTNQLKPGRKATLTCQNLLLEFATENKPIQTPTGGSSRATDLRKMLAKGAIHLQEGEWSLMGSELQYTKSTETVRLDGSSGVEARIMRQQENDGGFNMWRGDYLIWNRNTNNVEAPNARVTSR